MQTEVAPTQNSRFKIGWGILISVMTIRAMLGGGVAGALAALVFTVVHGLMISDIWFMLLPMLTAGIICGLFLGWSFVLLSDAPSIGGWLRYNVLYLILLFALGPISLLMFEPVVTIPALLASPDGLPAELVRQVTPLAAAYTVVMTLTITLLYSRRWSAFPVVLATSGALMLLLGLNIAPMGLVFLTSGWVPMLLELLALILVLNLIYAVTFAALAYKWLENSRRQIFST